MANENTQSGEAQVDPKKERLKNRILKPGESFGNFRVVRCMSSSLLANYYHMQHVRDLHDVTVCVFHPRTIEDPKLLKRLEGLQAAIKTIDHEGVPKIHDCAELNDRHCIFMDAVEGQTLSEYCVAHGQPGESGIGVDEATLILARLLGLFGSAHAQGVDHRDLDSDLVFIKPDGSIQVLGLGLKATLGSELFEAIVSASVSPLVSNEAPARINSFDVMSPEYRRGVVEDLRVDLYGAGYIAYWLLTGLKVDLSNYQAPSVRVQDLPQSWDALMKKALQRNPENRYQTCKSVLVDLKATEEESESVEAGLIQRQIDCLPVPKGIVERGELATRIYRLSVIGLVGVTLTALVASFVHSIFDGESTAPMAVVKATEDELPNLRLTLSPAQAHVRFEDVSGVFRAKSGTLDLVLLPGSYEMRIAAPQHVEQLLPVTIDAGGALSTLDVQLVEELADLEILTSVGATIVAINEAGAEVELGVVDAEGRFVFKRSEFSDSQGVVIRKEGYSPLTLEDLSGESVEAVLVELPSGLTVRTQPEGARVFVNDIEVGRSPITLNASAGDGSYRVVVEHEGYRSAERRIQLELGEHDVVDFGDLVACAAALDFTVTFAQTPESAIAQLMRELKVDLDGAQFSLDAPELQVVSQGAHAVRLVHPVYSSDLQSISVVDQADQTLTYVMRPLPGRIELKLPEGVEADVRVNAQSTNVVDGEIIVGANQRFEVELSMRDHLTMMRRFELKPDQRVVWDVAPVPIPGPEAGQGWVMPYSALKFSWIDAGHFSMGSPMQEAGRLPNEGPLTEVRFSRGFWAGMHEVTQAQYFQIMEVNPSSVKGASLPVDHVTWEDAKTYCRTLSKLEKAAGRLPEGYVYRLPTEAEWEYLARGGSGLPFAFGDRADPSNGNFQGVYPGNLRYESKVSDHYGSLPVGSYVPNAYGLHDTHGNVAEWTLDRYNGRLHGGSDVDPQPRQDGRRIAVRGGSWEDFAVRARSAARAEIRADMKSNAIGFRAVLAPAF